MKARDLLYLTQALLVAVILVGSFVYINSPREGIDQGRVRYDSGGFPRTGEHKTLIGRVSPAPFPVSRFGPAPAIGDTEEYMRMDVAVLNVAEPGNMSEADSYYLHCGGRTEMIPYHCGGNAEAGGVTFDELGEAFKLGLYLEVEGYSSEIARENNTYRVFHVEGIEILESERLPLIIHQSTMEKGKYGSELGGVLDMVTLPTEFVVGRKHMGVIWRDYEQYFEVILNPHDKVLFWFNSTEPLDFVLYAPNNTMPLMPATRWGVPIIEEASILAYKEEFSAPLRGTYAFRFSADPSFFAEVVFGCDRVAKEYKPLLFVEEGSHSSDTGGMGTVSVRPMPLPDNFTVGRTWSEFGAWTDHAYRFKTTMYKDDVILFGFDASEPINFNFVYGNEPRTIVGLESAASFEAAYMVERAGTYVFTFDVDAPRTSVVAFRCVRIKPS